MVERILGLHLFPVLASRAFGEAQFAYRPRRGARDAVLVYVTTWLLHMNERKKIGVYCSDVSGAFDRVPADRLLEKLSAHGLHADLLEVVRSWLRDRKSFVVVAGVMSEGATLSDMVYQGTVFGPVLWNAFVGDVAIVFESAGFAVIIYADDVNAYKAYEASTSNANIFQDLRLRQTELHRWGSANRVTFDAGKESLAILSLTDPAGEHFKVLGLEFDPKLAMRACVQSCVSEAAWRFRTLLRTKRFYNDGELVGLFKAHVLSFVEYRTPGVHHAATTILDPLDRVLTKFLREIGITDLQALVHFNLAPLSSRRDMAMLGVIHRALLGAGPPQLDRFFVLDSSDLRRSARNVRHTWQLECSLGDRPLDVVKRSVLGLRRVYNMLPADIVGCRSVQSFQKALQALLRQQAEIDRPHWPMLFSPRWAVQSHPLASLR